MGGWQACLQMLPSIVDPPIHALTSSRGVSVRGENLCNLHYLVKMPIPTVGSPSPFHLTSKLSSNRDSSFQGPHIFGALYRKSFRKILRLSESKLLFLRHIIGSKYSLSLLNPPRIHSRLALFRQSGRQRILTEEKVIFYKSLQIDDHSTCMKNRMMPLELSVKSPDQSPGELAKRRVMHKVTEVFLRLT